MEVWKTQWCILGVTKLNKTKRYIVNLRQTQKFSKYGKEEYTREIAQDLTHLRINNWLQLWDSNPLWVTENPKS
jgi:hypothetical protein